MSFKVDLDGLSASLSSAATVMVPDTKFANTYANWNNYNLKTPLAVVKPAIEGDILTTIRFARENSLLVSARGGGHSCFNTVEGGIVIDLEGCYAAVTYDEESKTITVQGGAKNGDVLAVLAKNGRCAMTGACNSVGFVPMYLAGGFGPLMPKLGLGIDNIISARLLLASGDAITTTQGDNRDIFDVICGAGQTLGIVSELKVKTHSLANTVGSDDGSVWSGAFVYSADSASDVADMLEGLTVTPEMAMYMAVTLPPPEFGLPLTDPIILFALTYYGSDSQADAAFADMDALTPVLRLTQRVAYEHMNDQNEAYQQPGGFKRPFGIGLDKISGESLVDLIQQLSELTNLGPDLSKTCVMFELLGVEKSMESSVGVFPYRSVKYWCCPVGWYYDPRSEAVVEKWGIRARNTMKAGDSTEKVAVYTNFRAGNETAEELWGSSDNIARIGRIKMMLDPLPMFQSLQIV